MEVTASYSTVYERLQERMEALGEAAPETMAGFEQLHEAAVADGALDHKVKS